MGFCGSQNVYIIVTMKSLMILLIGIFAALGVTLLTLNLVDPLTAYGFFPSKSQICSDKDLFTEDSDMSFISNNNGSGFGKSTSNNNCATVEEMGEVFGGDDSAVWRESLRVRKLIQHHFHINGASRVRQLPPDQFCGHGFILAKATEAGIGNEMYKILTAAALSIMLNRSLIIGQTRGKLPFGDYITYTDDSFTLKEVRHLWEQNGCKSKYGRDLVVRVDNFLKPSSTNILCSNWMEWEQPIIWIQNTTDTVAAQFFLKNVHPEMRSAASELFGKPELNFRPNVFGELMKFLISPSVDIEAAVKSVLADGEDPDFSLHMRMQMTRSVRAEQAALSCIKKAMQNLQQVERPKVVLVSDTPSFISNIRPNIEEFAEVLHFDYEHFQGNISADLSLTPDLEFRVKDWGPAPRWVAFVDFFLASRAKHAVITGAGRRVGTTYAQLIAALAAAHNLGDNSTSSPSFSFLSSFQSNLLKSGLSTQVGWGHAWNRFAGPLSCHGQAHQCAYTPLLPSAWWDGIWQSPIPRDIRRLEAYGVRLSSLGTVDEEHLQSFCKSRKTTVIQFPVSSM